MSHYKFRFSDMIPNTWFHKLKNMKKPTPEYTKTINHSKKKNPSLPAHNHAPEFTYSDQRKSYYFTRDLTLQQNSPTKPAAEPPRKSSQRRRSTKRSRPRGLPPCLVTSSISAGCSCGATVESVSAKPDDSSTPSPEECTNSGLSQSSSSEPNSIVTEYGLDGGSGHDTMLVSWSTPCKCGANNDIIIDLNSSGCGNGGGAEGEDHFRLLPPIITKKNEPAEIHRTSTEFSETNAYGSLSVIVKENFVTPVRRLPARSPGMKLRVNSPRIVNRRGQGRRSVSLNSRRRSISESFAVVKASKDPRRDFRESMVEMILENNIRASNDLEELLACYLSLNSDEYHDLIINVFKQIWFDFIHLRPK